MRKAVVYGILASLGLTALYFAVTSAVSGSGFALSQFEKFWYFIITLALGFGIQVGLYSYLKQKATVSPGMVGFSGATSGAAMVSCCAHYLVNLLPVLGAVGIVTFITQYQIEFFWIGIVFNLAGIAYMMRIYFKMR